MDFFFSCVEIIIIIIFGNNTPAASKKCSTMKNLLQIQRLGSANAVSSSCPRDNAGKRIDKPDSPTE